MGASDKVGTSRVQTDLWGEEYIQYYDENGNKTGTSREKTDLFGNRYVQHYDKSGNKTGTSREKTDLFGNRYVQHYDEHDDKAGTSREKTDLWGEEYVQHYDEHDDKAGTSREKTDLFGDPYVQHYDAGQNKAGFSRDRVNLWGGQPGRHPGKQEGKRGADRGGGSPGPGPAEAAAVGGSPVGLAIITGALVAIPVLFYLAVKAWHGFVSRNTTGVGIVVEYVIPLLTMAVIAMRCAAKDRRLLRAGILEGAVTAAVISLIMRFGFEPVEAVLGPAYSWIVQRAESSVFFTILGFVIPYFMYLLVFLPIPVAGILYRVICSGLEPPLKEIMDETNPARIRTVCWESAILFCVGYLMLITANDTMRVVMRNILIEGVFVILACRTMSKLAVRAVCAAQA